MKIKIIKILSSSGSYTYEGILKEDNFTFKASVPKGTSKSKSEVKDSISNLNYVNKFINKILRNVKVNNLNDIKTIESLLYQNVKKLSGNAILVVSYVLLRYLSFKLNKEIWELFKPKTKKFPIQLANVIEGGKHQNQYNIQEILLFPKSNENFVINVNNLVEARKEIGEILNKKDKNFNFGEGLEGGWITSLLDEEKLQIAKDIAKRYKLNLGVDVAASSLFVKGHYLYENKKYEKEEFFDYVYNLIKDFKIKYIEDPFEENDFKNFYLLNRKFKNNLVVGDDLLSTNKERLKVAIKNKSCNASIVKPNQIGSLFKTVDYVEELNKNKLTPIFSHRSQETCDNIISDLVYGLQVPYFKIGISGGERLSKINRLMELHNF